ncbi:MAG: DUF4160 domain-containing protein [Proteobacteria bacterium]|jgi:hypothetical protein|nr:MAG: DUF4160 domain-containing protein [Pseudomonadota bacterium]
MPTVLRENGFRFYFYSHEPNEPPHVHVDRAEASAKIWLEPVAVARNLGFSAAELHEVVGRVRQHQRRLVEAWYGYFGNGGR